MQWKPLANPRQQLLHSSHSSWGKTLHVEPDQWEKFFLDNERLLVSSQHNSNIIDVFTDILISLKKVSTMMKIIKHIRKPSFSNNKIIQVMCQNMPYMKSRQFLPWLFKMANFGPMSVTVVFFFFLIGKATKVKSPNWVLHVESQVLNLKCGADSGANCWPLALGTVISHTHYIQAPQFYWQNLRNFSRKTKACVSWFTSNWNSKNAWSLVLQIPPFIQRICA